MSIKNTVTVSLVIFIIVVIVVLAAAVFFQNNNSNQNPTQQQTQTQPGSVNLFVLQDVAAHNTVSNCWEIVSGKVYNVTSLISIHKNGQQAVGSLCGKDATEAFNTMGGLGAHPAKAQQDLQNYYIGDLSK